MTKTNEYEEPGNSDKNKKIIQKMSNEDTDDLFNAFGRTLVSKPPNFEDPVRIQEWWLEILHRHEQSYKCYATFLALPSDIEAIHYWKEFGNELSLISGKNCLIIALSNIQLNIIDSHVRWNLAIQEHVSEGFAINMSNLMGIDLTEFPCLVFFRDIQSPENVTVSLRDMKASEISKELREVFSAINKAISKSTDPLNALERHYKNKDFRLKSRNITGKMQTFAGNTLGTILDAWIKAIIK